MVEEGVDRMDVGGWVTTVSKGTGYAALDAAYYTGTVGDVVAEEESAFEKGDG